MAGGAKNDGGIFILVKRLLAPMLCMFSFAYADFLSLNIVEKEEPPPKFVYGMNYAGRIFAGGIDNFIGLNSHLRINKSWAAGAKAEMNFSRDGYAAGAFFHYFPTGELFKENGENYVHFGIDYIKINEPSPLLSIGYGRDMLPWKKSPFGFRTLGRIEYALAPYAFTRENKDFFGLTSLANTVFAIEIGVFMY
jgi:hypothetical protein